MSLKKKLILNKKIFMQYTVQAFKLFNFYTNFNNLTIYCINNYFVVIYITFMS